MTAEQLAAIQGPSVDEIVVRLGLTPEQEPAARSVLEAAAEERSEMLPGLGGQRPPDEGVAAAGDVLDDLAGLDERAAGMLEPILTADQLAQFLSIMAHAQEAREDALNEVVKSGRPPEGGPQGRRPGGPGGDGFPRG